MSKLIDVGFSALTVVTAILFFWCAFVWLPVALWTEQACLERGMAKAEVTISLNRYCMNVDGAITVKVERLK